MKLRSFLYLNTNIIEEYISAIDGYTYHEENQEVTASSKDSYSGNVGVGLAGIDGKHSDRNMEGYKRSVIINDAAKFNRIYNYLKSPDDEEPLKYYEFLDESVFDGLRKDDFIEVLVTARFSKMKEMTDAVRKISELKEAYENISGNTLNDKKTDDAINGMSLLGQINAEKGIACVFEFDDKHFPIVAYLDEKFFRCEHERFVGQSYLLCKIIRKIPKGKSIELDEVLESFKSLPLNREQRRKMPKNLNNPAAVRDVIKGPALVVLPIAVYQ